MEVGAKKYTFEELEIEEKKFQRLSEAERSDLLAKLYDSFADLTPEQDYEGRYSYFHWFTYLAWSDLFVFSKEIFSPLVIKRQIFEALLSGFDVWAKLIFYFEYKNIEPDDYRALYIKVKDAFVNSGAIIGQWQGKTYRVADAVKEKALMRSMGENSIRAAEFLSKLKKIIALDNDRFAERFLPVTTDEVLNDFDDLIDFFLDTEPEEMEMIAKMYVYPDVYGVKRAPRGAAANAAVPPIAATRPVAPIPVKSVPPPASKPIAAPMKPAAPAVKPVYSEIKRKIEERFKKNKEGEFADLDGIFSALAKAAEKYNDPKIAEMLYFDEKSGKFVWNM